MKYHLNNDSEVKECHATKIENCPFSENRHFKNEKEVQDYFEQEYFYRKANNTQEGLAIVCPICGDPIYNDGDIVTVSGEAGLSMCCSGCIDNGSVGQCVVCKAHYKEDDGKFDNDGEFLCKNCEGGNHFICPSCHTLKDEKPIPYSPSGWKDPYEEVEYYCSDCYVYLFHPNHGYL